jgi:hypothetical protein
MTRDEFRPPVAAEPPRDEGILQPRYRAGATASGALPTELTTANADTELTAERHRLPDRLNLLAHRLRLSATPTIAVLLAGIALVMTFSVKHRIRRRRIKPALAQLDAGAAQEPSCHLRNLGAAPLSVHWGGLIYFHVALPAGPYWQIWRRPSSTIRAR